MMDALRALAVATAIGVAVWATLQIPMDVPDTSSPPFATASGSANNWTSVGQTFVPRRSGLDRVSVILAAQMPTDRAEVAFHIKETPRGEPLRTVRRPISSLPAGEIVHFRPHIPTERWYTFEFEPIPDSAGRKLYFSVEGRDVPHENTVRVLMHYHSRYPQGEAYLNEEPTNAHLLFRAYSRGRAADWLGVLGENLRLQKPDPLASPIPYLAAAMLYALLTAATLAAVRRLA